MPTSIAVTIPDDARHIQSSDASAGLRDVIDNLIRGECFVLTRFGVVVGYIVPAEPTARKARTS